MEVTVAAVEMCCSDRPDEKFGRHPDLIGWAPTIDGRPSANLLPKVRHFRPDKADNRS